MLLCHAHSRNDGFTLVEMITAAIIVGVLAAVTAPNLLGWYNKQAANSAFNEVESAIREAQKLAIRNGRSCTVNITNSDLDATPVVTGQVSGGCLLNNRILEDFITLNSDQNNVTFLSKGNTTTNALIRVSTKKGGYVDKCLVVTNGLGLIRTGDFDVDNNTCQN